MANTLSVFFTLTTATCEEDKKHQLYKIDKTLETFWEPKHGFTILEFVVKVLFTNDNLGHLSQPSFQDGQKLGC